MKTLPKVTKNKTWQHNHNLIETALLEHLKDSNKSPTIDMYVQKTGLSDTTVKEHLKELSLDRDKLLFKPLIPIILSRLFKGFMTNPKSAEGKLLMQLIADYREENKTVHEFTESEAKEKIENLFLK
jgi:hypothetical protein